MGKLSRKEREALRVSNREINKLKKEAKKEEQVNKRLKKERLLNSIRENNQKRRFERGRVANWFTLDNAGIIYPSIREENWDFVYRVSALLTKPVDKELLQKAVDEIQPRFPSFFVSLKSGFFWNYFEENKRPLEVQKESNFPCFKFPRTGGGHLIRILYYNNRISLECFHALADGRSALKLLNSLVKHYLELSGTEFQSDEGCLNFLDKPKREELADSFSEHSDNSKKLKHKELKAYRISGTPEEFGVVNSTIGVMSVGELKEIAKQHNAKLFEFMIAVLAESILKRVPKTDRRKNPIKISVPVDLRQFFNSESLRNFSGYLNIEIPIKAYEFSEILTLVRQQMKKITKEHMQGFINGNVSMQKNYFIKLVPLFIKNFVIKLCFKVWGENYQTLAVSNLGQNKVPEEFSGEVSRFEFNLGRPKYNAKSMGIVSFGDKLVCTMSSKIKENTTEKDFFTRLAELGVNIKIESNRRDLYE